MNLSSLEKDIAAIVTKTYESPDLVHYPYHNLEHTQTVVAHVQEMASFYLLTEKDCFVLTAAAWFHDIGHLYGEMHGHEERGVVIMEQYLYEVPYELIAMISECILATKFPSRPTNLQEKIICDADTFHFGTPAFRQTDLRVRQEMEIRTGKTMLHWTEQSLQFLQSHCFYTTYCQKLLTEGKRENIAWLESLLVH